jgi:hypothetical protein
MPLTQIKGERAGPDLAIHVQHAGVARVPCPPRSGGLAVVFLTGRGKKLPKCGPGVKGQAIGCAEDCRSAGEGGDELLP